MVSLYQGVVGQMNTRVCLAVPGQIKRVKGGSGEVERWPKGRLAPSMKVKRRVVEKKYAKERFNFMRTRLRLLGAP